MRNQVHLPISRQRIPFIPFANPLKLIDDLSENAENEECVECGSFDMEEFIDLIERAAAGDPNVEIGASHEIAGQLN